ncbi:hypothetical protein SFRURICE_013280 [Spodoptera frugiperda]|nr:hypothetical protein SFRURICE_013280 [Spodoptera frugiperda]
MYSNLAITKEYSTKLSQETKKDESLQLLKKYYYEGWPKNKNNVSPLLKPYWNIQAEIHRNPKSHWEHATVKERCPDNRSYIVEDINKVRYRRNRVHLRHKYCNGSDNPTPMRSNSSQGRDEGDRQEPENPKFPQLYKTKPGRVVRPTHRLIDEID